MVSFTWGCSRYACIALWALWGSLVQCFTLLNTATPSGIFNLTSAAIVCIATSLVSILSLLAMYAMQYQRHTATSFVNGLRCRLSTRRLLSLRLPLLLLALKASRKWRVASLFKHCKEDIFNFSFQLCCPLELCTGEERVQADVISKLEAEWLCRKRRIFSKLGHTSSCRRLQTKSPLVTLITSMVSSICGRSSTNRRLRSVDESSLGTALAASFSFCCVAFKSPRANREVFLLWQLCPLSSRSLSQISLSRRVRLGHVWCTAGSKTRLHTSQEVTQYKHLHIRGEACHAHGYGINDGDLKWEICHR